jgi:hypothetical protein
MDRDASKSIVDYYHYRVVCSPELALLGSSGHGSSLRRLQNREDGVGLLTTVLEGSGALNIWPPTIMNGRRQNELGDEENGVRRCGTGGGMSFSGERPRWGCLL